MVFEKAFFTWSNEGVVNGPEEKTLKSLRFGIPLNFRLCVLCAQASSSRDPIDSDAIQLTEL